MESLGFFMKQPMEDGWKQPKSLKRPKIFGRFLWAQFNSEETFRQTLWHCEIFRSAGLMCRSEWRLQRLQTNGKILDLQFAQDLKGLRWSLGINLCRKLLFLFFIFRNFSVSAGKLCFSFLDLIISYIFYFFLWKKVGRVKKVRNPW